MFIKANVSGPDGVPLAIVGVEPVSIDEDSSGLVHDNCRRHYGSVPIATPLIDMTSDSHNSLEDTMIGNNKTPQFRDLPFLILYLVHLAIMIFLALDYGSFTTIDKIDYNVSNWRNLVDDDEIATDQEWQQFESIVTEAEHWIDVYLPRILRYIIVPSAFVAYAISYLWTAVIIPSCPTAVVVSALLGSLAVSFTFTIVVGIVSGFNIMALLLGFLMMAGVGYYLTVQWRLIPFAAINLSVALQGISANCGMYLVAFAFSIVGFLWTLFWVYIVVGVMQAMDQSYNIQHPRPESISEKEYIKTEQDDPLCGFVFFAFLLSLYWTTQILLNTVHVTVAGVMATWCFVKEEAQNCCSIGVWSSLYRSLTYSLGSICMGSLLQAVITAIRVTLQAARNNRTHDDDCGSFILCLLECVTKCLEDILEYFNQWAYVYVGVYGYSYLESGKRVTELFKARGFTTFVANDLVGYVLGFTNVVVGVVTGMIAILIQIQVERNHSDGAFDSHLYGHVSSSHWLSMMLGFFVGVAVSSIITNVIRGAVNTLIVCFADDPAKLEDNHPELSLRMVHAWSAAFPDCGMNTRPMYSVVV